MIKSFHLKRCMHKAALDTRRISGKGCLSCGWWSIRFSSNAKVHTSTGLFRKLLTCINRFHYFYFRAKKHLKVVLKTLRWYLLYKQMSPHLVNLPASYKLTIYKLLLQFLMPRYCQKVALNFPQDVLWIFLILATLVLEWRVMQM